MTPELSEAPIETMARVIYARYEELPSNVLKVPTPFPAWIEGGNSTMQDEARRTARAALDASGLLARERALREALEGLVYETTHLSPADDDGSHVARISRTALIKARTALSEQTTKP